MNIDTGEVRKLTDEQAKELPNKDWAQFAIGEELNIKGIWFKVHDVGDQRLVLKFVRRA